MPKSKGKEKAIAIDRATKAIEVESNSKVSKAIC